MARPTWTRKTYEMVASAVNDSLTATDSPEGVVALNHVADKLGRQFKTDNPYFDYHRFLKACGFGD